MKKLGLLLLMAVSLAYLSGTAEAQVVRFLQDVSADKNLTVGKSATNTGQISLMNATNANALTLKPGTTGSNLTLTLPAADGTNGQFLKTDGNGVLSFDTPTGSGDVTDVGDAASGAAFTADGAGNTLYFEGSTADEFETLLTAEDATVSDKTVTIPSATGYAVVNTNKVTDVEGTALGVTAGTLDWDPAGVDADFTTGDVSATDVTATNDVRMNETGKLVFNLDDSGDTYIECEVGDTVKFYSQGSVFMQFEN